MSPTLRAPLIGRKALLHAIDAAFAAGWPVVTLVGPAGVGKTAAATAWASREGARWAHLEVARDAAGIWAEIARALQLPWRDGLADDVAAALSQAPVVLDNAEQVVDDLADILGGTAGARVLVTSREALHIAEERVLPVDMLSAADGVALYERHAWRPGAAGVADLVARLEGLPLAIELAAARSAVLSPTQLLDQLDAVTLRNARRDRPPRHHSLQAAIDWSWTLLDDDERSALVTLSTFAGGFLLVDAAALLGCSLDVAADRVEALTRKSLIRSTMEGDAVVLRLFDAVRRFTRPRQTDAMRSAHVRFVAALGEQHGPLLVRSDSADALRTLQRHWPDLRVAIGWAAPLERAAALVAWGRYLQRAVPIRAALVLIEEVLADSGSLLPAQVVQLCSSAALYHRRLDQLPAALAWAERAVGCAEERGSAAEQGKALAVRGDVRMWDGDLAGSAADLRAAAPLSASGEGSTARIWRRLAGVYHIDGHPDAHTTALHAVQLARKSGDLSEEITALCHAALYAARGQPEAAGLLDEAMVLARRYREPESIWVQLVRCNRVLYHSRLGEPALARRAYRALLAAPPAQRDRVLSPPVITMGIFCHLWDHREPEGPHLEALAGVSPTGGARRMFPLIDAVRGWRAFVAGDIDGAARLWRQALGREPVGDVDGTLRCLLALTLLHRGDLAAARAALPEAPEEAVRWTEAALSQHDPAVPTRPLPVAQPGEVHFYRMLLSAIHHLPAPSAPIQIATDGSRLVTPDGAASLAERHIPRRVLHRLVVGLQTAPGEAVPAAALIEAGWPGERMRPDSARQRLWATIRILRGLGLGTDLETVEGGYRLHPDRVGIAQPSTS